MIVLSAILSTLLLPAYLLTLTFFFITKTLVQTILKVKHGRKLQLLDSADTYWTIGETHHNVSYLLNLFKEKPGIDIVEAIKTVIIEKILKHRKLKKMLCSVHSLLGYSFLLEENIEADDFITIIDIDKTSYLSIRDIIYDFGTKPLPVNGKLLWEIIIVKAPVAWKLNENLKADQIPIIVRINHCISDGLSLMNAIANSFGDQVVDLSSYLKNIPKTNTSRARTYLNNFLIFFIIPGWYVMETIQKKINRRLWKGPKVSHKQNIAYKCEDKGDNLIENIKKLKRKIQDISFTEIIMAAISSSLYRHFLKHSKEIPESVLLFVVATRDLQPMTINGIPILTNQFGMINVELPIKKAKKSMLETLKELKKFTRPLLSSPSFSVNSFCFFNLLNLFPHPITQWLFPMAETVGMSNLPGFPKIEMCNGHQVEDVYFFVPQRDQNGIGFSVLTYDDRLHIGLTADEASISSKNQCDEIVNNIFKSIELLKAEVENEELSITICK